MGKLGTGGILSIFLMALVCMIALGLFLRKSIPDCRETRRANAKRQNGKAVPENKVRRDAFDVDIEAGLPDVPPRVDFCIYRQGSEGLEKTSDVIEEKPVTEVDSEHETYGEQTTANIHAGDEPLCLENTPEFDTVAPPEGDLDLNRDPPREPSSSGNDKFAGKNIVEGGDVEQLNQDLGSSVVPPGSDKLVQDTTLDLASITEAGARQTDEEIGSDGLLPGSNISNGDNAQHKHPAEECGADGGIVESEMVVWKCQHPCHSKSARKEDSHESFASTSVVSDSNNIRLLILAQNVPLGSPQVTGMLDAWMAPKW